MMTNPEVLEPAVKHIKVEDDFMLNRGVTSHSAPHDGIWNADDYDNGFISDESQLQVPNSQTEGLVPSFKGEHTNFAIKTEKNEIGVKTIIKQDPEVIHELIAPFPGDVQGKLGTCSPVLKVEIGENDNGVESCRNDNRKCSNEMVCAVDRTSVCNMKVERLCSEESSQLKVNSSLPRNQLQNVSVTLRDIFSSNTDKFGAGHSSKGHCSCIFCQGEFNVNTHLQFLLEGPKCEGRKFTTLVGAGEKSETADGNGSCEAKVRARVKVENLVKCKTEVEEELLICDICPKTFRGRAPFVLHRKEHRNAGEIKFSCKVCRKAFTLYGGLTSHLIMHSKERPFLCNICPKTYKHKGDLDGHLKLHSGEKVFKCGICSKIFDAKSKLVTHLRVHTNERPYSCKLCPATFKQSGQLPVHMRCVHRNERLFNCSLCSAPFKQRTGLNAHMRYAHSKESPFKCKLCSSTFKDKRYLKHHMYKHTHKRPWKCDVCKRKSKSKDQLRAHILTHQSDRPFSCDACPAKFKARYQLNAHKICHTSERRYQCEHCAKKFLTKCRLRNHIRTHSDERPFSCSQCTARFETRIGLRLHRDKHSCDGKLVKRPSQSRR